MSDCWRGQTSIANELWGLLPSPRSPQLDKRSPVSNMSESSVLLLSNYFLEWATIQCTNGSLCSLPIRHILFRHNFATMVEHGKAWFLNRSARAMQVWRIWPAPSIDDFTVGDPCRWWLWLSVGQNGQRSVVGILMYISNSTFQLVDMIWYDRWYSCLSFCGRAKWGAGSNFGKPIWMFGHNSSNLSGFYPPDRTNISSPQSWCLINNNYQCFIVCYQYLFCSAHHCYDYHHCYNKWYYNHSYIDNTNLDYHG